MIVFLFCFVFFVFFFFFLGGGGLNVMKIANVPPPPNPGGGTPIIFSWGCAAGTLRTFKPILDHANLDFATLF